MRGAAPHPAFPPLAPVERLDEALQIAHLLLKQGFPISQHIILRLLQGCSKKDLLTGRQVHCLMSCNDLDSATIVGDCLIRLFASCKSMFEANLVFCMVAKPSVYTWQAIISAHYMHRENGRAIELYHRMLEEGIKPNKFLFPCVLNACSSIGSLRQGMLIHQQIIMSGLDSDVVVGSTLIDMYAKCRSMGKAQRVFDKLQNRNVVSWNALMTGYSQNGHGFLALKLFEKMELEGLNPNKVTFLCLLKACGDLGAVGQGKLIHHHIIKCGLHSDVVIGNTLVDMYCKCSRLEEAGSVFFKLPNQTVVSWGAMIGGYAEHGNGLSALTLFEKMQQGSIIPDKVTFLCLLKACCSLQTIDHGKLIHDQIVKSGLALDVDVGSTLVDMYAKCGRLEEARKVFDELPNRTVVSWSAMIMGYTQHGLNFLALELYEKMQLEGMKPDKFIFSGILKACGSLGAMEQGKSIHDQILRSGVEIDLVTGNTLVDMYIKCGNLQEACKVFDEMPVKDVVSWSLIIAGYAQHGNCSLAGQCLNEMHQQGLKPNEMIYTCILSACSHAGQAAEGHQYFNSMNNHGISPCMEQFTCMVELLGRAGHLQDAECVLQTMPFFPNVTGWMSLLTACRRHSNLELGKHCFDQIIQLDPYTASGYMLISNIYANTHLWKNVHKTQDLRKCVGAWKKPGMAWIEVNNVVHEFIVGDKTHPQGYKIYANFKRLRKLMDEGYVPQLESVMEVHALYSSDAIFKI